MLDGTDVRDILRLLPHHSDVYGSRQWVEDIDHYPQYAKLFSVLSPRTLIEVGTFLGYSLATAAIVLPELEYIAWVDTEEGLRDSNTLARENVRTARRLAGHLVLGMESLRALPAGMRFGWKSGWDLAHVDARHDFVSVCNDITMVHALEPRLIIGHDYCLPGSGVRDAVHRCARELGAGFWWTDRVTNGLFLMQGRADRETATATVARLNGVGLDFRAGDCP